MSLDLDVYLLKKPDIDSLVKDPGLVENDEQLFEHGKIYRLNNVFAVFDEPLEPSRWSCSEYGMEGEYTIEEEAKRLKRRKKKIILPKEFIDKVKQDNIVADEQMYEILQKHPKLAKHLERLEPLWGILNLTKGKSAYGVRLTVHIAAHPETVDSMTKLAQVLAVRYDGIIWDDQTNEFNNPDPKRLNEIGMSAFGYISSVLENQRGWDLRRTE